MHGQMPRKIWLQFVLKPSAFEKESLIFLCHSQIIIMNK